MNSARTLRPGGYAEHRFLSADVDGTTVPIDADHFTLRLSPGCGATLTLHMERYVNPPTIRFPWDRQ